ncbi:MAG TPA: tetratricopeptide repeat protein, partial [Xanthobacteraceae bacterium]
MAVSELAAVAVSAAKLKLLLQDFLARAGGEPGPRCCLWATGANVERSPHSSGEQPDHHHRLSPADKAQGMIKHMTRTSPQRLARVVAIIAASALSACQTVSGTQTSETEGNQYAASPANLASLSSVVERNPNDPQAYNMRGSVYGQAGRHQEALADFNKAISLDPNYAQAYANRALIYRQTGKADQALADYNKALSLDQSYAVAYLGRGIVYRQK